MAKQLKDNEVKMMRLGNTYNYSTEEVKSDSGFEHSCMYINESMHKDAKKMTVMEYETALKILKERSEEMEKTRKKHK